MVFRDPLSVRKAAPTETRAFMVLHRVRPVVHGFADRDAHLRARVGRAFVAEGITHCQTALIEVWNLVATNILPRICAGNLNRYDFGLSGKVIVKESSVYCNRGVTFGQTLKVDCVKPTTWLWRINVRALYMTVICWYQQLSELIDRYYCAEALRVRVQACLWVGPGCLAGVNTREDA